jgi:hypothetical protein
MEKQRTLKLVNWYTGADLMEIPLKPEACKIRYKTHPLGKKKVRLYSRPLTCAELLRMPGTPLRILLHSLDQSQLKTLKEKIDRVFKDKQLNRPVYEHFKSQFKGDVYEY